MSLFRTLVLVGGVAALAACGQMAGDKNAPADAPAADASGTAAPAAAGDKPPETAPTQAPAGQAPDKPT